MDRIIDVAGRSGQPGVHGLLCRAVGSDDPVIVQPIEIRYRNDQHWALYGLYLGEEIAGLIGCARRPTEDEITLQHVALRERPAELQALRDLVDALLARRRQRVVKVNSEPHVMAALAWLGYSVVSSDGAGRVTLQDPPPCAHRAHCG